CLGGGLAVLDLVLGGLDHHEPLGAVARAARPAGDLVGLAGLEDALPPAVELGASREQDSADGYVDPHAAGVAAAADRQQTLLREPLHETAVLGEHAGVMDADPVEEELA